MSRLYEDWKKAVGHKLPTIYRKSRSQQTLGDITRSSMEITIPLKSGQEPSELPNNFVDIIEKEYAVRYLEQIGVEPSQKHIQKVIKEMPLKNCQIKGSWYTSSWLADAIKIFPRGSYSQSELKPPQKIEEQKEEVKSKEEKVQKQGMDLEYIKQNYLYPYMRQSALIARQNNPALNKEREAEQLQRMAILEDFEDDDGKVSKIFRFPFDQITVATQHIKELMNPIEITVLETVKLVNQVVKNFPIKQLPLRIQEKNNIKQLENALKNTEQDQNIRLIGLVSHFCYWTVFGHIHSIGLSQQQIGQLFSSIMQIFRYQPHSKRQRQAIYSILLLIIRISVDLIFEENFQEFYSINIQKLTAQKQIQNVITKLLDPDEYLSRFSFLESSIEAMQQNSRIRNNMAGKYFSTSSMVKTLFPQPQHHRTRCFMAKKETYDGKLDSIVKTGAQIAGTMPKRIGKLNYFEQNEPWKSNDYLDVESKAKLYKLAVAKAERRFRL